MLLSVAIGLYVLVLLLAAASDATRYRIPNSLSLLLLAGFVAVAPMLSLSATAAHLSAGAMVLIGAVLAFVTGVWGGGDAKLVAAASVWIGWSELATFLLLTALFGAALALLLLAARRMVSPPSESRWYSRLLSRDEGIPYGVAIAAAGLVLTPSLPILHTLAGG